MGNQNHKFPSGTAGFPQEKHRPGTLASSLGDAPWFAPALTAVYALILFYAMLHHEMWRDEIQPWLLARDSAGVLDLLRNMKYEGHPPLWHLLLMPITRLTSSPFAMQILHLAIAATTVFVVAKYAPFRPLHKILLVFGYFPLYEYGVISRHYALALLLVVVTCVLLKQRHQKPLRLALALFLMSYTHALACIIAISITLGLALDYFLNRRALAEDKTVDLRRNYVGFVLVVVGILLSILQMNPAPDAPRNEWLLEISFGRAYLIAMNTLGAVTAGLGLDSAQTQAASSQFTEIIAGLSQAGPGFFSGLAILLQIILPMAVAGTLAAPIACYWKKPAALAVYLCCITGVLALTYMVHLPYVRHYGFILIAVLLLIWSGRYFTSWFRNREGEDTSLPAARPVIGALLTVFLAIHAFGGLKAVADDVGRPFSYGKQAAAYIEAEGLDSLPMIGELDYIASTVVGHLQRKRKIHYARGNREGSFIRWDAEQRIHIDDAALLAQTRALAARAGGKVLMILSRRLSLKPATGRTIRPLASFTGDDVIVHDEKYHLYLYEAPVHSGQMLR